MGRNAAENLASENLQEIPLRGWNQVKEANTLWNKCSSVLIVDKILKNRSITLLFNYYSSVNLHLYGKVSGSLLYSSEIEGLKILSKTAEANSVLILLWPSSWASEQPSKINLVMFKKKQILFKTTNWKRTICLKAWRFKQESNLISQAADYNLLSLEQSLVFYSSYFHKVAITSA